MTLQLVQQTDAAHSAAAALAETRGRIEQITAMLNQERTERAAAEKQASAAEQAAAVLTVRLESAVRELDELRQQAGEARAAAKKAGEEAAELRGRLAVKPQVEKTKKPTA